MGCLTHLSTLASCLPLAWHPVGSLTLAWTSAPGISDPCTADSASDLAARGLSDPVLASCGFSDPSLDARGCLPQGCLTLAWQLVGCLTLTWTLAGCLPQGCLTLALQTQQWSELH